MRALLIVMGGVGIGGDPNARKYRDEGADTLGHLFENRPLNLPALFSLGLGKVTGRDTAAALLPGASFGKMRAASPGKDTTTALWEIAGVVSRETFATFERFPDTLVRSIETAAKVTFLGNDARKDGTLLKELGPEHLKTGQPILEVSQDSVMQIYAHEEVVPRKKLLEICRAARKHCNTHRINRVVAQSLTGKTGEFTIAESHIYPTVPPRTILNAISETGLHVDAIGNTAPAFARSGVTAQYAATDDDACLRAIEHAWGMHRDGLVFATLAGAGMHGYARNLKGFLEALENFDRWLAGFLPQIEPEDLLIITADHGSDPAFPGTGATREEVPLLAKYDAKETAFGTRLTFADVAATLGAYFQLREHWSPGSPVLTFPHRRVFSRRH